MKKGSDYNKLLRLAFWRSEHSITNVWKKKKIIAISK